MDYKNPERFDALFSGIFYCHECESIMDFENEQEEVLICPVCGHEVTVDMYGFEDEAYEDIYPTEEEFYDKQIDEMLEEAAEINRQHRETKKNKKK